MRALSVLAVLACFAFPAAGDSEYSPCLQSFEQSQQQDCCKANKGICGCRAGKIVCCDKSFADNCPCAREDEPPISWSGPTPRRA